MATAEKDVLTSIAEVLTDKRHDLRDAREDAVQELAGSPGNGLIIERLRVIGMLQNLQTELANTHSSEPVAAGK